MIRPTSLTLTLLALFAVFAFGCATSPSGNGPADGYNAEAQIETYADIVYRNYSDAYADAVKLQQAIQTFLNEPNSRTMTLARNAWLRSRESYGQSEVFRFYEGPIDFADPETGEEGPEGLINAWPLNEAYIDYVKGNPKAGIIRQADVTITRDLLVERNAADDEANVTTGYHAIEFLLWGQDHRLDGAGERPASDFAGRGTINERRRQYLKVVTDLLVDHLAGLKAEWAPGKDNYRKRFVAMDQKQALGDILTGMATLSGFELASERMAVALDSGDQEDEHSCFSDNTHRDIVTNAQGIYNVYFGTYGDYEGAGINRLVGRVAPELNLKLEAQIKTTLALVNQLEPPIDRILASEEGSTRRQKMEAAIASLQEQAELLRQLGEPLGVEVVIAAE